MYELTLVYRAKLLGCDEMNGEISFKKIESYSDAIAIMSEFQNEHPVYEFLSAVVYKMYGDSASEEVPDDAF